MREINEMTTNIYQRELLGLDAAADARTNITAVGRYLRAAMLAETEELLASSTLIHLGRVWRRLRSAINEARPKFVSAEGKAMIAEFDRMVNLQSRY